MDCWINSDLSGVDPLGAHTIWKQSKMGSVAQIRIVRQQMNHSAPSVGFLGSCVAYYKLITDYRLLSTDHDFAVALS